MTKTITMFVTRKPGISFQEFQDHYENSHVPLIKSLSGDTFPLTHTRYYVQRDDKDAAVVFMGKPEQIDYDAYAQLTFADEEHFQRFFAKFQEPEVLAKLHEDDGKFSHVDMFKCLPLSGPYVAKA